jgi:ABC-type transporter Mla subunit MlaD
MRIGASVAAETIVQFAPKTNAKPEAGDPIDQAAQAIFGMVHRIAADTEAKHQQALAMTHQLSAQLRAAEDRIRDLEAHVRHYQERADRAEKWLHRVSLEIDQQFFGRGAAIPAQPPPPQALLRGQRR